MAMRTCRGLRVAALTLTGVVLGAISGCANVVGGHGEPGMTPVDVQTLQVGPFSPVPVDYEFEPSGKNDVFRIESRRMMAYLVAPYEIDKDMHDLDETRLIEATDSNFDDGLLGVFPAQYKPVVEQNNLIAGVYTMRTNNNTRQLKALVISVLRFPSDAAASMAAEELDRTTDEFRPGRHAIPVDTYPDARASSIDDQKGYLFAARGPYVVLSLLTVQQPDPNALADRFKTLLDLQFAKLAQIVPIPVDDILDLPVNPDGIMRRVLPKAQGSSAFSSREKNVGIYAPDGQLHFERKGPELARVFRETGVDLVASNDATVYRTRDFAAAVKLQTALAELGRDDEAIEHPPGILDTRCVKLDVAEPLYDNRYLCIVVRDRYVAVVGSQGKFGGDFDVTLYQRAAAQYSILANSE